MIARAPTLASQRLSLQEGFKRLLTNYSAGDACERIEGALTICETGCGSIAAAIC